MKVSELIEELKKFSARVKLKMQSLPCAPLILSELTDGEQKA